MSTPPGNEFIKAYVFFDGRCDEAIEFYGRALGAEIIRLSRFGDSPDPAMRPAGSEKKVMHAELRIRGTTLFVSDGRCTGKAVFEGFSLTIEAPTDAEAEKIFAALADGGQVQMPMGKSFFASRFGMAADRFGIVWMVISGPTK